MSSRKRQRDGLTRNKERASMSFFIVVMFFAVFGVIVVTEVLLMDERGGRGAGVLVRRGSIIGVSHRRIADKPDYDDALQVDDYLTYRGGSAVIAPEPIMHSSMDKMLKDKGIMSDKRDDSPQHFIIAPGLPVISDIELINPPKKPLPPNIEVNLPRKSANFTAKDGMWQIVNGTRYKFFVFSAFYDRRKSQRAIRVIGATRTRSPERVWCRLWYDAPQKVEGTNPPNTTNQASNPTSVTVMAKVKVIRENWNLKYSACFVLCPLGNNKVTAPPNSVSIVSRLRFPPANHLLVRNTDREVNVSKIEDGLAICVKPLHFNYNQALQILEFLELNTLMGVKHFTFYNHTSGSDVGCILQEYQRDNSSVGITLLPWQLDMVSQKEIRTEGLFSALNDCLYRSMYRYSHAALIDVDEYIMPKHNDTIPDLLTWMGKRLNVRLTGSYSFQNAFFYLQWGDDPSIFRTQDRIEAALMTLRKTRRKTKLHPHKQRSKYICRPELVVEAGNHFVWEFVQGHGTLNVPADAAILHHYRVCEFGGDDCIKTSSIVDRTAYRFKTKLVEKVRQKYQTLMEKCRLPNLPPLPVKTTSKPKVERLPFENMKVHTKH